ncbi:hypothetical protein [Methylobacterium sp. Leaf125]|uniref:hypothetical protein n=1 Tax=Methylobacterium sp. Leaf125 TaxID=1736265 RepID=UPI001AEBB0D8|nr:hypothetical protein [Methylobacterium sp. Leaf125]
MSIDHENLAGTDACAALDPPFPSHTTEGGEGRDDLARPDGADQRQRGGHRDRRDRDGLLPGRCKGTGIQPLRRSGCQTGPV